MRCTRPPCAPARRFIPWAMISSVEAFADVPAWSSMQPAWQRKYLGTSATVAASLRELFSDVMLDVAWGLFELRMLRDPSADPNAVWTDITARYLNIVPHPEISWWAMRVQLVRWPGYMINYGLGAVLTADIRQRTARGHRTVRYRQRALVRVDLEASAAIRRIARDRGSLAPVFGQAGVDRGPSQPAAAPRPIETCSRARASLSASSSNPTASSTSASPIMSGGMKRTVLCPHDSKIRPW